MSAKAISYNRHLKILDHLAHKGKVRVDELSEYLDVSPVTIRRDLDILDKKGLLSRTHGGAASIKAPIGIVPEKNFLEKGIINTEEKRRIAEKAVSLVADDEILYVNSGSTVLFFIEAIKGIRARIFTNNAQAISCKRDPQVELVILGGEYREQSQSFVGIMTLQVLQDINSTHTILGTNGISLDKGLTTSVIQECSINQNMIANTNGKVIVLADYSKIGRVSNFVSAPLEKIDILVTDSKCPPEMADQFRARGIEVIIA